MQKRENNLHFGAVNEKKEGWEKENVTESGK